MAQSSSAPAVSQGFGTNTVALLKKTAASWSDDKAIRLGASLAYYSVFSLGPLLIIAIAIAGLAFGQSAVEGQVFAQLREFLGDNAAKAVQGLVAGAQKPSSGILATVISAVTLVATATGVVVELKDALNTIWKVKAKDGRGVRFFLMNYVISVAALLGFGFILIVSLVMTTALAVVGKYLGGLLPVPEFVMHLINFVLSFGAIALTFALMFKYLPDVRVSWSDVWPGAVGTAFFFLVGKEAIGLYIGKQSLDSSYGAAASIVAVLIWVYYLSQVVFLGAEFTKAYVETHGSHFKTTDNAVLANDEGRKSPSAPGAAGLGAMNAKPS